MFQNESESQGNSEMAYLIDLFSLGGVLPHFRPYDDTLEILQFQIFK